ncbi:MAG TPA: amidohydrolase family protein, partial [Candidatus Hodarchaeales archaeon]|nr:amidohydrolase family protein [Candidatus Hodarchaeales archaeon]
KCFTDGSLGAKTAALREPYVGSESTGILVHTLEELKEFLKAANDHDWQIETHAIGDRGAEIAIQAYEDVVKPESRPVLTHCQVLTKDLVVRMAKHNIIANIQPVHLVTDKTWAEMYLGKSRMRYAYAWKSLLKSGVHCAGGSDAPVEACNPLLGIHAAVNRQDTKGDPVGGWYPKEKLSVWEAVGLWTTGAAYAEWAEKQKGILQPGTFADMVVLDKDPFKVDPKTIKDIRVLATIVGGVAVFHTE